MKDLLEKVKKVQGPRERLRLFLTELEKRVGELAKNPNDAGELVKLKNEFATHGNEWVDVVLPKSVFDQPAQTAHAELTKNEPPPSGKGARGDRPAKP